MDALYTTPRGTLALLALLCLPVFAQEMTAPEPAGPPKPAPRRLAAPATLELA